jgi:hypothetical protein
MQVIDDDVRRAQASDVAIDLLDRQDGRRSATSPSRDKEVRPLCAASSSCHLPVRDMLGAIEVSISKEIVWVQKNRRTWARGFRAPVARRARGRRRTASPRSRSSSPAEGSAARHTQNQDQIIARALDLADQKVRG